MFGRGRVEVSVPVQPWESYFQGECSRSRGRCEEVEEDLGADDESFDQLSRTGKCT